MDTELVMAIRETNGFMALKTWRRNNPGKLPDLWGANLWGANLLGANLSGANLLRADLSGADLRRADLWGAKNIPADVLEAYLNGLRASVTTGPKGSGE